MDSLPPQPAEVLQATAATNGTLTCIQLVGGIYCHICNLTFEDKKTFEAHYINHNTGKSTVYTCVICRLQITTYTVLRDHYYRKHLLKDKFRCNVCERVFSKHKILEQHISKVHNKDNTPIKCSVQSCKQKFKTLDELNCHKVVHRRKNCSPPYPCKICKKLITNKAACEEHVEEHCIFTYNCPICNEEVTKSNVAIHLTEHFGETTIATDEKPPVDVFDDSSINMVGGILCLICDGVFKNNTLYDAHFTAEHGVPKAYWCNVCNKEYDVYRLLASHCYEHLVRDKFKCDSCDKSFRRLSALVEHNSRVHLGAESELATTLLCGQEGCGAGFRSAGPRRRHLREVHGLGPHICDHCDDGFKTSIELAQHMQRHAGTISRSCRQCGLQFVSSFAAQNHIDIHKKKDYSCPVCDRKYQEKYLMANHINQHFETVLHMCNICSKVYDARHRLVEHLKTHTEMKIYQCNFCDKSFAKLRQLENHVTVHTGDTPYKCELCSKKFRARNNWYKHMKNLHKVDKKYIKNATHNKEKANILDDLDIVDIFDATLPPTPMESDESTMDSGMVDPGLLELVDPGLQKAVEPTEVVNWIQPEEELNLIDTLPDSIADFITESVPTPVAPTAVEPVAHNAHVAHTAPIPCEYGPDFTSLTTDLTGEFTGFIDLDHQSLPTIDPRLAHQSSHPENTLYTQHNYIQDTDANAITLYRYEQNYRVETDWSSPKLVPAYGALYTDLDESRFEFNTDIF